MGWSFCSSIGSVQPFACIMVFFNAVSLSGEYYRQIFTYPPPLVTAGVPTFLSRANRSDAIDPNKPDCSAYEYPVWNHVPYLPTKNQFKGGFDYTRTENLDPSTILSFVQASVHTTGDTHMTDTNATPNNNGNRNNRNNNRNNYNNFNNNNNNRSSNTI